MSEASDLVVAVLAHIATAVPGVVVRNEIPEGEIAESARMNYPWARGLMGPRTATPGEEGQADVSWLMVFQIVQDRNQGEIAWTQLESIVNLIEADYTLGGLATRALVSEGVVDHISNRARTSTAFSVTAQVFR